MLEDGAPALARRAEVAIQAGKRVAILTSVMDWIEDVVEIDWDEEELLIKSSSLFIVADNTLLALRIDESEEQQQDDDDYNPVLLDDGD